MKRVKIMLSIILVAVMLGCGGCKQSSDDLILVDIRKNYPRKELILQDFLDVEYIVLETNDEFVNQGGVRNIGKKFILVGTRPDGNGDIFLYERNGKALRKINHKGQGPGEYIYPTNIILDEDNEEIFVCDGVRAKIFVYDLHGQYKRSFIQIDGVNFYTDVVNYDRDHLICYDEDHQELPVFLLVSKQDGSKKEIKISFKEKRSLTQMSPYDPWHVEDFGYYNKIIHYNGSWILSYVLSDTVYSFLPDYNNMRPFMVRTPSVQSMGSEFFLLLNLLTDRYYFMETVKNEFNFSTRSGFPRTYYMYDNREKEFFGYAVYNGDYSIKKEINMSAFRQRNHEEAVQILQSYELVEAYKKGELKGKLKEIAAKLDEEDNPVIMLVKQKK